MSKFNLNPFELMVNAARAVNQAVGPTNKRGARPTAPPRPSAKSQRSPDLVIELQMANNRKQNRRLERNKRNHERQQAGYYYAGVAEARREAKHATS